MTQTSLSASPLWRWSTQFYERAATGAMEGFRAIARHAHLEVLEARIIDRLPAFKKRMQWFLDNRRDLAAQVSFGVPWTFIPQLPQIPIRHDQRYERLPSRLSLTKFSPSSTDQSFRKGTS